MPISDRYHRQRLLPGIGDEGQSRLGRAHVLVVGCGALGSVAAEQLARAGVGTLTLVDRDVVEATNLQRQVLYDEADAAAGTPKAVAAARALARANSGIELRSVVADVAAGRARALAEGVDLIVDGLDNLEARYLLNDLAVARGIPLVYGGAVGTTGLSCTILPHPARREADACPGLVTWDDDQATPCLRCLFPEAPPPGTLPTCDTAGVLGPVVALVASRQSAEALKLLAGHPEAIDRSMLSIDAWTNAWRRLDVAGGRRPDCPACGAAANASGFPHLDGGAGSRTVSLCGREAVQVLPPAGTGAVDLAATAARLASAGTFTATEHLLRGTLAEARGDSGEPLELTLFADGRGVVRGTSDPETARRVYARYVGL